MSDAYAANVSFIGRRANNTNASRSALAANDIMTAFAARGYGSTGYSSSNRAAIHLNAEEAWSDTNQGTNIAFNTTPTGGSTTQSQIAKFTNQGYFLTGTNTNDNASAGQQGEYASTIILLANEISSATATTTNIVTLSLTAGDWDVWGELWCDTATGAPTGIAQIQAGITTTSATIVTAPADANSVVIEDFTLTATTSNRSPTIPLAPCRQSLSTTTTIYLVVRPTYTGGTMNFYGKLAARRVR